MDTIFTVSALTDILRDVLEKRLPFVWVRGEVTNLSHSPNGHTYFCLKDDKAQLNCVWFAGKQQAVRDFDPLTGEVFEKPQQPRQLCNGMEALCAGDMGIYAPRGIYQLRVEFARPVGAGLLAQKFEEIKRRLAAAGYFSPERKRPLPPNPERVALVTSPHGAAIHDFLKMAQTRGAGAVIRLHPVQVQGSASATQVAEAISFANLQQWAQVIVLIRGGGSLEDLWSFNEEETARAVYESALPVLAGIGHEVDFTLADMTADARAATPTHAAQMLWPLRSELEQKLDELASALGRAINSQLALKERELANRTAALNWLSPRQRLDRMEVSLKAAGDRLRQNYLLLSERRQAGFRLLADRLNPAGRGFVAGKEQKLERLAAAIRTLDPEIPLGRGYALLLNSNGVVSSVKQISPGDRLAARLSDGMANLSAINTQEIHLDEA